MKVWVTGAAGMLGREVVDQLRRDGVPHVGTGHELDITEPEAVGGMLSRHAPTHVVNCAAFTRVDDAERERELAARVNAQGPELLGRAAHAIGASVVHYSTDYVFSGTSLRPYAEDDTTDPVNVYGHTKLDGERRLRAACPSSFVVRASWLFGTRGPNFVTTIAALLREREQLQVVDDQHGRPTYAPDLAAASLALAGIGTRSAQAAPGIYHFANAGETTWHVLACAVRDRARTRGLPLVTRTIDPVSTQAFPRPAPRPRRAVLDTGRIEGVLGAPPRAWTDALDAYFEQIGAGA